MIESSLTAFKLVWVRIYPPEKETQLYTKTQHGTMEQCFTEKPPKPWCNSVIPAGAQHRLKLLLWTSGLPEVCLFVCGTKTIQSKVFNSLLRGILASWQCLFRFFSDKSATPSLWIWKLTKTSSSPLRIHSSVQYCGISGWNHLFLFSA